MVFLSKTTKLCPNLLKLCTENCRFSGHGVYTALCVCVKIINKASEIYFNSKHIVVTYYYYIITF